MTKIKFCGLTTEEAILTANKLMPDYIGFVFWKKSSRYIDPAQAEYLKSKLHPEIKAVGVFVDEDPETISALLKKNVIDIAQLHGNEDASYIDGLRSITGRQIIKAFKIQTKQDLIRAFKTNADYPLLDSGMGSGQTFDWSLNSCQTRPFFLAGGLNPENVADAISAMHPFAVDVSSGIETEGKKAHGKMEQFALNVKSADLNQLIGNQSC